MENKTTQTQKVEGISEIRLLPWNKPEVKKLTVNLDTAASTQNSSIVDFGGEG